MSKLINLTGQRFGRLIVIERNANKTQQVNWHCVCDCGNVIVVRTGDLRKRFNSKEEAIAARLKAEKDFGIVIERKEVAR